MLLTAISWLLAAINRLFTAIHRLSTAYQSPPQTPPQGGSLRSPVTAATMRSLIRASYTLAVPCFGLADGVHLKGGAWIQSWNQVDGQSAGMANWRLGLMRDWGR
jgi:hypothetical protein